MIENQKEYFNQTYKKWTKDISNEKLEIMKKLISDINVSEGTSLLDVGAGTGVLYVVLKDINLKRYLAIDISEKMLEELNKKFPEVENICCDYDKEIKLNETFDYIIIFNSIPHFNNLDVVFDNSYKHLNKGGKFVIAHARTREGLRLYRQEIGYHADEDGIPNDMTLNNLCKKYNFTNVIIEDTEFFSFRCEK